MKSGSCLCGAVLFQVSGQLRPIAYCHCTQCRKQSGLYYAATQVGNDSLTIDDSAGTLSWYRASEAAERGFCNRCGSSLFWRHDDEDSTSILMGAFDQPTGLKGGKNIFTETKGDFYELPEVER